MVHIVHLSLRLMPRIHSLSNCRLYIYADDHAPPHFHVVGADSNALVLIERLEVMAGVISRTDFAEAHEWARGNREYLLQKWSEYNERK